MVGVLSTILLNRLEKLHPRRIDLSLKRMERLLAALGNPERRLPPVVPHSRNQWERFDDRLSLRAVAESKGQRVHVYTSPHRCVTIDRSVLQRPDEQNHWDGDERDDDLKR